MQSNVVAKERCEKKLHNTEWFSKYFDKVGSYPPVLSSGLLSLQVSMPHQWLEGNLPVSAKCSICDKTCGSVLRLQDWRCLWCKAMVRHTHTHT